MDNSAKEAHRLAIKRQFKLAAMKRRKFIDGKMQTVQPAPKTDADFEKATLAAAFPGFVIPERGQMVDGEGIYIDIWQPKDARGNATDDKYIVYGAPEDLTDADGNKKVYCFADAVKRIDELKGWHGHDGAHIADEKELFKALKADNYNGGWFIPPREVVEGKNVWDKKVLEGNLHDLRETGALKDSFNKAAEFASDLVCWYWSLSAKRDNAGVNHIVNFKTGETGVNERSYYALSCRPVRLVKI